MRDELAARIRLAVSLVPAGSVVSYGDVAALVGTGPRQVGAFMRDHGEDLPWWRVVNASGELPPRLRGMARALWAEEGIAERTNGSGCQIERHRADLPAWADAVEAAQR